MITTRGNEESVPFKNQSLRRILILRLVFGCYFKFSKSAIVCTLLKLYCIACCIMTSVNVAIRLNYYKDTNNFIGVIYNTLTISEKITIVFISLVTEEKHIVKFISSFSLDSSVTTNKVHFRVTNYIIAFAIIWRIFCTLANYEYFLLNNNYILIFELMSSYLIRLTTILVTESYLRAVEQLCNSLKENLQSRDITDVKNRKYVKDFAVGMIKLTHNLDATINLLRLQVTFDFIFA